MIPEFPDRMRRYAIGYFGADGEAWLEALPDILTRCCEKWGLTLGPVVKEIKANYVGYAAMSSGEEVILKVGVPRFVQPEMKMLEIYDGRGINRMIDHDLDLSAMLLERFRPGTMLRELDDSREPARIAGRIIKALHQTPTHGDHPFWVRADELDKSIAAAMVCKDLDRARPWMDQLTRLKEMIRVLEEKEGRILLHGDLHHSNIFLDKSRGWTAIDPQCRVGPSCLEFGSFIGNAGGDDEHLEQERRIISEAIRNLSETSGASEERVYAGALFEFVLWASGRLKDEPDDDEQVKLANLGIYLEIGEGVDLSTL